MIWGETARTGEGPGGQLVDGESSKPNPSMKNQILLPLFLGLALAGCTRTNTDAQRLSSNDQSSDPSKPLYNAQTDAARKDAADQAQVATAANPNPAAGKAPTA